MMTRSSYRHLTSLILTFLIQGAFAANIIVNTTTDDENPGDGKCTLREAVNNANTDSDNTEGDCKKGKGLDTVTSTGEIGYISLDSPLKVTEKIQFRDLSIDGATFEIINYFSDVGAEFTKVSLSGGIIENNGGILTIKDSHLSSFPIINENGGITIKNSTLESGSYIRSYYDEWSEFGPPQGTYIEKTTFMGNSGNEGGAITQRSLSLTIIDSTFSNNFGRQGGALYLEKADTTIINSTFSGNSATEKGGAIFNQGSFHRRYEIPLDSYLYITNSTFSNNSAPKGGGIFNDRDYYVDHETIEGDGCSICQEDYENNREFCDYECWFLQDATTKITEGKLSLKNTIIANSEGEDCYNDGSLIANLKNFIGDGSCKSEYSGDPNLGPLVNNGGTTLTHALLPGSIAIDAGDDTVCAAEPVYGLDQRGKHRTGIQAGNHCDIGAFELTSDLVELIEFTAIPNEKNILFKWETGAERYSAGFYLWRAEPLEGNCEQFTHEIRLTDKAIPSQGDENSGAYYEYRYEGPINASNSCYGLEERETSGKRNFYIIGPGIEKWKTFSVE